MTANTTGGRPRGLFLVLLATFLALGFFPISTARAVEGCGPVRLDTFTVEIGAARDIVRVGGTATLRIEVRRTAADQNLGPAEHAEVIAAISVGDFSLGTAGETDHDGVAELKLQLPRRIRPGLADVVATATSHPAHCVEEFGRAEVEGLFRVVR